MIGLPASARGEAVAAAMRFRLPFRSRIWRGQVGNWAGAGAGSSIDFQDHRPYVPGDDPRHVDWQAYARSGHYIMKLYREEVSPAVDVVLDASLSMRFDPGKKTRALELLFFTLESAREARCAPSLWVVGEGGAEAVAAAAVLEGELDVLSRGAERVQGNFLESIPLRPGSLRVLLSDCLFADPPELLARRLVSGRGQAVVLAPSSRSESDPDWLGDVDLLDCETSSRRLERIDEKRLLEYGARYRNHFSSWEASSRRYGIPFARIPSEETLSEALRNHALPARAVEPAR